MAFDGLPIVAADALTPVGEETLRQPDPSLERLLQYAYLKGVDISVHAKAIERRVYAAEAQMSKALVRA